MENFYEILSQTIIFKGLDPSIIESLFKSIIFRIKKYSRDEYVAYSNDICENLLILLEGSVRGDMTDFSGKTIKIENIYAPAPIATAFLFGKKNKFPVDVIANEKTTVLVLPKESLIRIFIKDDTVLKNYLDVISNRTQFLSNKIKFLSFKTIKEKLAHYILSQAGNDKLSVTLPETQTGLADYFGVTRPSLSRALLEMQRDGLILVKTKDITIVNKEKLVEFLK